MTQMQKVLIVDDSQTNLALLNHMLAQEGCDIVQAKSGIEAIELVRHTNFALILLDIQMPGMNGYETALKIKEFDKGRHVPIIFITAIFQDEDNVRQGYETGAVDYLFRPVDVETLKSKVQVFLQLNEQKMLLEREIDQRRKSEHALGVAEEKYRSIFERAVEGIFQATVTGVLSEVNPAMVRLFGYDSADEMVGVEAMRQHLMIDADEREEYIKVLKRDGFVSNFEFRARKKDGEIIWCSESSRLVTLEGKETEFIEGVLEDVTKRKLNEMELKHLATVDSLTGVPNRHLFFDRAEHALAHAKRYGTKVAVLFVDLNDFKRVNDTYGHQTGDELLRMVAERLMRRTRETDTLARLGGDEFGVLLTNLEDPESAVFVSGNLLEVMDSPFIIQGESIKVGATVGISYYPDDGKDCVTLISRADAAMYGAKKRGGVRFGTFKDCGVPK
ncbi:two-component system response regulator [Pseudodesulfovibrio piezophilus]|uniref:Response regulator receiver modulated diguanylate cyclase with PAS/PAC sensor n=1 Tax=Pseudodesulfovibrio piezophilus (strain DSM 21447 / JCM 15486 / C1TLV30) TaxID=1322246 RepID=M1WR24_PSEP2|nr:diguanylate cyclase [Pseudodesulfovibrio piezophilus]CCH48052.1 Response regulator receiver modulated diguanylate cyclase with PAS/PAC sensor [Pseudodesulfovibrio piezophilus C1TLV30]